MPTTFTIRPATPSDVEHIFKLIKALAEFEQLSAQVTGNQESLAEHLFGERPYAEAIVAEITENNPQIVGFALFFYNYSTFLTKPGIYVEDIFVLPAYRTQGIGKALLTKIAQIAWSKQLGRLEWTVLDWNQSAIAFYEHLGAEVLPDWRVCRVIGDSLYQLAQLCETLIVDNCYI